MILALTAGAGAGLGLALIVYGLRPPRPALADLMDRLTRPPVAPPARRERVRTALASPAARFGLPRARVRTDLGLLGVPVAEHLAEQTALTVLVGFGVPLAAWVVGFGGQVPLWLAVLAAAAAWWWADAAAAARAERVREDIRHTLSVTLTLIAISLARGAGIEQALDEATGVCTGPAADRLRAAMAGARILRLPPWQALGDLGDETAIPELCDLAAAMGLAGSDGARVRASLAARAAAMRTAATSRATASAAKAGSRMTLPLLALGMTYLLFLLYPAVAALTLHT